MKISNAGMGQEGLGLGLALLARHLGGDPADAAGSEMIFICFGPRGLGWERAAEADANFAARSTPFLCSSLQIQPLVFS